MWTARHSIRSNSITAGRPCGRTIASGHTGRDVPPRSRHPARRTHHPQGLPPDDRLLLGLSRKRSTTPTGLAGYLRERGFERVTLCGLATDFCVFYSAIDASEAGFKVVVDLAASRAIDLDASLSRALAAMREAGVELRC